MHSGSQARDPSGRDMLAPTREPLTRLLLRHGLEARQTPTAGSTEHLHVTSAAEFYIPHLPGLPANARQQLYAGLLPATSATVSVGSDAHLFFLLAKAKHIADRQRLVIWFNGGPGCSSFDGALMEIGPVRMSPVDEGQLVENEGAWNQYANVLFVDQPAGTGYSYRNAGQPVTELAPAAEEVVTFLNHFFTVFPELAAFDLYLAGESYAGQYVPYIASAILKTTTIKAPLKGLLIGNAWLDPAIQYPAYLDYALFQGIIKEGSSEARRAESVFQSCNATLAADGKGKVLVPQCEGLLGAVMPGADEQNRCVNSYNTAVLEPCGTEYPADAIRVRPYLREAEVINAFHATSKVVPWEQCNGTIGEQMWSPASRPAVELLPAILDQGVQVALFAGELDLVCNWLGIERTLEHMTWQEGTGLNTTVHDWYVNNAKAGTWQVDRGVHWIKVINASHMVAIEKPLEAHDMLLRFIGVEALAAAGDTARLPSQIGNQRPSVLGLIAPDGKTLNTSMTGQIDTSPLPDTFDDDEFMTEEQAAHLEQNREALYGPRRSAVLALILLVVIVMLGLFLRWRARKRLQAEPEDEEAGQPLVEQRQVSGESGQM